MTPSSILPVPAYEGTMEGKTVLGFSSAVAAATAAVAAARLDVMLCALEIIFLALLLYPYRRDGALYGDGIPLTAACASLALIALGIADSAGLMGGMTYNGVAWIWILELLCVPVVSLMCGMMLALCIDRYTGSSLDGRWTIVMGIVFAMAFSAFYIFTVGFDIWYNGLPFNNEDVRLQTDKLTDRVLMAPSVAATVTSVLGAVVIRELTKKCRKSDLIGGRE